MAQRGGADTAASLEDWTIFWLAGAQTSSFKEEGAEKPSDQICGVTGKDLLLLTGVSQGWPLTGTPTTSRTTTLTSLQITMFREEPVDTIHTLGATRTGQFRTTGLAIESPSMGITTTRDLPLGKRDNYYDSTAELVRLTRRRWERTGIMRVQEFVLIPEISSKALLIADITFRDLIMSMTGSGRMHIA